MPVSVLPFWLILGSLGAPSEAPSVITGDYLEDRSNHVYGCYCEWSGEGEYSGREAILAWHVRHGRWNGVDLTGLRMAAVVVGNQTLSRGHTPRRSVLFFDGTAEQRQAGEAMLRRRYAEMLGLILGAHQASIDLRVGEREAVLRVGGLLDVRMREARLPDDALQGAILWYDPFTPTSHARLGTTLESSYRGREFDMRWSRKEGGVTGYYGIFALPAR